MKTPSQQGTCRSSLLIWKPTAGFLMFAVGVQYGVCASPRAQTSCAPVMLRGHVEQGSSYTHAITPALDFKLEAVPAGWMVRVLPHGSARPPHDYAELANPPYRSPTPLLISTDFSFRAQDAIAWNPRSFRYFADARTVQVAESAYQSLLKDASSSAAASLFDVLPSADEATLTIVDADLSGGSANQTAAAARVASHLAQTAHHIHSDGQPSQLGVLLGLTFQVMFPAAACQPFLRR